MFIKLPSGMIIQIEKIVRCQWEKLYEHEDAPDILYVYTIEDNQSTYLKGDDAKRLYEYLESISIQ